MCLTFNPRSELQVSGESTGLRNLMDNTFIKSFLTNYTHREKMSFQTLSFDPVSISITAAIISEPFPFYSIHVILFRTVCFSTRCLAMSRDIFICQNWWEGGGSGEVYWHLVGRARETAKHHTINTQDKHPQQSYLAQNVNHSELRK